MEPVSNSYLSDFFPATNLLDSPSNRWITEVVYNKLRELKNYTSEFEFINQAIQQIPVNLNASNVAVVLENFNRSLAGCSEIMGPLSPISCIQEVEELEQQLNEHDQFLGELWAILPITDKPVFATITQIRNWFNNQENQILLNTVTDLDLEECEFVRISKELCKLSNLQTLRISSSSKHIILPFALEWFKKLKEIKIVEKIICQNISQAME